MRKLKILHIAVWYPSQRDPVSGIFVREHVKATALYNDVVVVYRERLKQSTKHIYQIADNIEDDIRTLRINCRKAPILGTSYLIYLWASYKASRKLIKDGFKPDIIHAHVYRAGVPAALLSMLYRIPIVVTEHSSGFAVCSLGSLEKFMAKFAFKRAACVCPVSYALQKAIENYGIKARFQVVSNTVDTSLFCPIPISDGMQRPEKRFLFTGILDTGHKKGIPYLIVALKELKRKRTDWQLDIIGDGGAREEYQRMAESLGIADKVTFHGESKKEEVAKEMQKTNFLVLPSITETFGVVLIEAMACGKPVIAANRGGPSEIVTKDTGILVPPGDPVALANTIDHMLDHYHEYDTRKITEYVRNHYSYEAVGKAFNLVYANILG